MPANPTSPATVPTAEFASTVTRLRCKRCKKDFNHVHVVNIGGVDNLMISGAKVFRLELVCLHCGKVNYWNQNEKDMVEQTEKYVELLALLHGQTVEVKE
jgi:hypothetical protein